LQGNMNAFSHQLQREAITRASKKEISA
jgi:hypothetical protein